MASALEGARFGTWWDRMVVRLVFSSACVAAGYHFHPFGLSPWVAALVGLSFSLAVFLFEMRLERASLRRLIGAAVGSILGILGAYLMGLVLARTSIPEGSRSFLDVGLLLVMTYIGLVIGARTRATCSTCRRSAGCLAGAQASRRPRFRYQRDHRRARGRHCEAHFLDGVLLLPTFVLRELQLVADSAES